MEKHNTRKMKNALGWNSLELISITFGVYRGVESGQGPGVLTACTEPDALPEHGPSLGFS